MELGELIDKDGKNYECKRFIARDVRDYAEKAPAGLVIDSQTITKVRRRTSCSISRCNSAGRRR